MRKAVTMALCMAALGIGSIHAMPPQEKPPQAKKPVARIPYAHRIDHWQPLDTQRVMVSVDTHTRYLLTLKSVCPGLIYARSVGVTMSNNTIWAGFDAITTDSTVCEITRIDRLSDATPGESAAGS